MDLPCWEVSSWPGGGVLKFLQEKLKEDYKWERDHVKWVTEVQTRTGRLPVFSLNIF